MNIYLLSYDAAWGGASEANITAFIKSNRFVSQWSFLYAGAFFLKSSATFAELDGSLTDFFHPRHYVICEIDPFDHKTNGLLSADVWEWLGSDDTDIALLSNRAAD